MRPISLENSVVPRNTILIPITYCCVQYLYC